MPRNAKTESAAVHNGDSSLVSLLSGWVQQGVENFFATQRILVDLAMTQNANAMNLIRGRFTDPDFCPAAIASELAGDAMTNFIEGQKLLLSLVQKEYEIVTNGVKERVAGYTPAVAATEFAQRGFDTFVEMQQDFLKMASKQTHHWLTAVKAGKGFDAEGLVEMAREGVETFVHTQKKFLDAIAEETVKATSGKAPVKKMKKTELAEIARKATESFIEAQKRLVDVAGRQMDANVKTAGKALDLMQPLAFPRLGELAREAVKSYVDAQRALVDAIVKPSNGHKPAAKTERHIKRPVRAAKKAPEAAAIA